MSESPRPHRSEISRQILDSAEDAFVVFDRHFRFVFANPAAERLFGRREAELLGRSQWEIFPEARESALGAACRRAMEERVSVNIASFREPEQRWYDIQAAPSEDGGLIVRFRDITGPKRAEDAVQAERRRFADVLDQLPAYLVLLSPDYHVPFANRFFRERFGESNGKRCFEYLFGRTEPCEVCETYKVLKTKAPLRWSWTGPDGRDYDIYDFPFKDTDGSDLIMEVGLDITERKRAEAAAEKERRRLNDVLELLPAAVCLLTPDYHVRFANRCFRELFGEANSRRCYDYIFNRPEPCRDCQSFTPLKTQAPHHWEWAAPNGAYVDIHNFPFTDPDGSPLILEVDFDITERKRAEAELAKHREHLEELVNERTAELEAANARLRAEIAEREQGERALSRAKEEWERTFDAVPDLIAILDGQHRIVRVNRAMAGQLGLTPEQCVGVHCYAAVHGTDAPPAFCPHVRTLQDSREHVSEVAEDRLGGDFLVSTTPLWDDQGQMTGSVHVARDITGRKRAERRLAEDVAALTRMQALSTKLVEEGGLEPLLQEIMDAAVAIVGAGRGTLQLTEGDSLRLVAHYGHQQPFLDFFAQAENRASVCGEALKRGQRVVVGDVESSPLFAGTSSLPVLLEAGVRAVQSTPLLNRKGTLLGVLTTQWSAPHTPDERDLWRLDLVARQAADLIEHVRSQEALRAGEERNRRLADLLERADQPFGVGYADGTLGFINPAFARLTGYDREELERLDWASTLTPPEWREMERAKLGELLRTGGPVRYEKEYVRKNGTRVPVELLVHLVKDEQGRPLHYYAFVTDRTERKKAEAELRRLAQFPAENPNPVLRVADSGAILYANGPARAWLAAMGRAPDQPVPDALRTLVEHAFNSQGAVEAEIGDGLGRVWWCAAVNPSGEHYVNLYGRDITDRKHAEEETRRLLAVVQEEKDRLQALINSMSDEVWFGETGGKLSLINRAALREFGPDLAGQPIEQIAASFEVYRPDGSPRPVGEAPHLRALRGEMVRNQEEIVRTPASGELRHRQVNASPVRDAAGRIIGSVSVVRDITERKRAEDELRRNREWLRVTLISIGDAVIAADTGGRITFLNPTAASLTGFTEEEALGRPVQSVFRLINEQTREPVEDLCSRVLKERRPVTLGNHTALLTKDGREVPIEDSAAPILDAAGEIAGAVMVFHDVTENRRAAAALAAAHAEVVDERNRLQVVMETLPVGVALIDAQGGKIGSNRAFEEVWGSPLPPTRSVEDYAAYKAWWASTGRPVQPEEWASARAVRNGETVVGQELQIERFDGTRGFVLNGAAPIRDASGKITASAVAIMDVTEQKRTEEALKRSNADLEQFAYVASHDLQEPLRTVTAYTQLLTRRLGGQLDADTREWADFIVSGALRMSALVSGLLEYSRAAKVPVIRAEPVDTNSAVLAACESLKASVEEAGAVISSDPLPKVFADQEQLTRIFLNLFSNSIKYRRPDVPLRVHVKAELTGGEWVFQVEDNGQGFAPQHAERIFRIFQRLHGREVPGTGIGLAIVKTIVDRHGGRIWAESLTGEGAVFRFTLPGTQV